MKIGMIGAGYVGLVTGTGFAEMGNDVICVDIDRQKIENLQNGELPIYEPGLKDLVDRNQKARRLRFTSELRTVVAESDILFIAVDTPATSLGKADLSFIIQASQDIGQVITGSKTIVIKSTVPVGTNQQVQKIIQSEIEKRAERVKFEVLSNPEFLKEGAAVDDFMRPDRIVIGCESEESRCLMNNLYEPFVRNGHPIYFMDIPSAEMTKYAANAMLATKISFMNEMSRVCEGVGADIGNVRKGIGADSRIGFHFIYAGIGYGGACFSKDIKALASMAEESGQTMEILKAVESVNHSQRRRFSEKVSDFYGEELEGKTLAIWGLAFKPGTDDMREAPALDVISDLTLKGVRIRAYDPVALVTGKKAIGRNPKVSYHEHPYEVLEGVDGLILLTEWTEFRRPNFSKMKKAMKSAIIFDGRNQFDPVDMVRHGFRYLSVGRADV